MLVALRMIRGTASPPTPRAAHPPGRAADAQAAIAVVREAHPLPLLDGGAQGDDEAGGVGGVDGHGADRYGYGVGLDPEVPGRAARIGDRVLEVGGEPQTVPVDGQPDR